ncbi:MAG: TIR domain-containing protein [Paludibacteraceae bacterium]|nr:TIR domain-containing protein [Paludibacteraceae bacterium]
MTYDIFISYRRDAFESANLFATRLRALGYRVFFDVETMNAGKFNEQLLDVISKCKDFILVLSPNALDRCADEQDWVRREVMCAMTHKKNIIPIMLSGFVWPTEMPKGMEELCNYQALAPAPNTYYDLQVKRLTGYLKSKAHFQTRRKWLIGLSITIGVLAVIMLIAHLTYMPVAQHVADNLTMQTQCMNDLAHISTTLQSELETYVTKYKTSKNSIDKSEQKSLMLKTIQIQEHQRDALLKTLKASSVSVNGIYLPLFWMHGISPADLLICDTYTESLFDDLQSQIDYYNGLLESNEYTQLNMRMAKINSNIIIAYTATYYYGYLQMMTHLPKSTYKMFYEVSPNWHHLPKAGIGWTDEEYERQQKLLADETEKEMAQLEMILAYSESELAEQEEKLRQLEEMAGEVQKRIDTMDVINTYILRNMQNH